MERRSFQICLIFVLQHSITFIRWSDEVFKKHTHTYTYLRSDSEHEIFAHFPNAISYLLGLSMQMGQASRDLHFQGKHFTWLGHRVGRLMAVVCTLNREQLVGYVYIPRIPKQPRHRRGHAWLPDNLITAKICILLQRKWSFGGKFLIFWDARSRAFTLPEFLSRFSTQVNSFCSFLKVKRRYLEHDVGF